MGSCSCARFLKNIILLLGVALAISSGILTIYGGVAIFAVDRSEAVKHGVIGTMGEFNQIQYPAWLGVPHGEEYNLLDGFMSCHDQVESHITAVEKTQTLSSTQKQKLRGAMYPRCTASQSPYIAAAVIAGVFMFATLFVVLLATCKGTRGVFLTTSFLIAVTFAAYLVAAYMVFARTNKASSQFLWVDCKEYTKDQFIRKELFQLQGFVCPFERPKSDTALFPLGPGAVQHEKLDAVAKWGASLGVFLAGVITGLIALVFFIGTSAWSFHRSRGYGDRRSSAELPLTSEPAKSYHSSSAAPQHSSPLNYTAA